MGMLTAMKKVMQPNAPTGSFQDLVKRALHLRAEAVRLNHWSAHRLSAEAWTRTALGLCEGLTLERVDQVVAKLDGGRTYTAAWSGIVTLTEKFNEELSFGFRKAARPLLHAPAVYSWAWTSDGGQGQAELSAVGSNIAEACGIAAIMALRARPDLAGTAEEIGEGEEKRLASAAELDAVLKLLPGALTFSDMVVGGVDRDGRASVTVKGTECHLGDGWPARLLQELADRGLDGLPAA